MNEKVPWDSSLHACFCWTHAFSIARGGPSGSNERDRQLQQRHADCNRAKLWQQCRCVGRQCELHNAERFEQSNRCQFSQWPTAVKFHARNVFSDGAIQEPAAITILSGHWRCRPTRPSRHCWTCRSPGGERHSGIDGFRRRDGIAGTAGPARRCRCSWCFRCSRCNGSSWACRSARSTGCPGSTGCNGCHRSRWPSRPSRRNDGVVRKRQYHADRGRRALH
jgi:hypothetical protein